MRNVVAIAICLATMTIFASCEKNEKIEGEKELSPPQWIQGEWERDGIVYTVYFKFTSDDVIFALPYSTISSFSDLYEDGNYTLEETLKSDDVYEITVTRNKSQTMYNFRKGDGTYIQFYSTTIDATCIAIDILSKKMTMFASCEKGDNQAEKSLVGKWVTSDYHAGKNDTIVFTKNFVVEKYLDHFSNEEISCLVTYSLSENKIIFTVSFEDLTDRGITYIPYNVTSEYTLRGNQLTIKGFSGAFSDDTGPRWDVNFTKIK